MISNNSRVDAWDRCRREYYYSYELGGRGIRPQVISTPLVDGLAIHAGVGSLYLGSSLADAEVELEKEYAKELTKFTLTSKGRAAANESLGWGRDLLKAYTLRATPVDDFQVVEVETEFNVVLGDFCWSCNIPYVADMMLTSCNNCGEEVHHWVGRADLVVIRNNSYRVVDHKTTRSVGGNFLRSFANSMQLIGYCYGIQKQNKIPVRGYGVNVIKKLARVLPYEISCKGCQGRGTRGRGDKKAACEKCEGSGTVEKQPNQVFLRDWYPCLADKRALFTHDRTTKLNEITGETRKFNSGSDDEKGRCFAMNPKSCWTMRGRDGCPYIPLCWGSQKPEKWYDIDESRIAAYYELKDGDYVDLVREEIK